MLSKGKESRMSKESRRISRERKDRRLRDQRERECKQDSVSRKQPTPRTLTTALGLGLPFGTYAIGMGLVTSNSYFWVGIIVAYIGAVWFARDWYFSWKEARTLERSLVFLFPIGAAALVTWIALRPAPLDIYSVSEDGNYPEGTEIYGIIWNNYYSDMRSVIRNDSSEQYTDLEIFVRTDILIRDIGIDSRFNCSKEVWKPFDITAPLLTVTDDKGMSTTIPIITKNNSAYGTVFRIYCDKLLPNEKIEIASALIPADGRRIRTKPSWVTIVANYNAIGRMRTKEFGQCFIGNCSNMRPPTML
jgi:hypothetical protein